MAISFMYAKTIPNLAATNTESAANLTLYLKLWKRMSKLKRTKSNGVLGEFFNMQAFSS